MNYETHEMNLADEKERNAGSDRTAIFAKLQALRTALDATIEEAKTLWWQPREYLSRQVKGPYPQPEGFTEYLAADAIVEPGQKCGYAFGVEYVSDKGIPNLPETEVKGFGIERVFEVQRLIVDAEIAPYFEVEAAMIGVRMMWHFNLAIAASRFIASAPIIPIGRYASPGIMVCLTVKNTSDKAHPFRAKIVGREQV